MALFGRQVRGVHPVARREAPALPTAIGEIASGKPWGFVQGSVGVDWAPAALLRRGEKSRAEDPIEPIFVPNASLEG